MTALRLAVGPLMQQGGGSGITDPTDLANLAGWWDASDTGSISDSGGSVTQWDDKSGNGRHLTPSGTAPTTGVDTINGLNALTFSAAAKLTRSSTSLCSLACSLYIVYQRVGSAPTYSALPFILTSGNQGRPFDRWHETGSGTDAMIIGGSGDTSGWYDLETITTPTVYHLQLLRSGSLGGTNNQSVWEYVDGTLNQAKTIFATWSITSQAIWVGARGDNATQFAGEIAEIVLYDGVLHDATERSQVHSYLNAKWAI